MLTDTLKPLTDSKKLFPLATHFVCFLVGVSGGTWQTSPGGRAHCTQLPHHTILPMQDKQLEKHLKVGAPLRILAEKNGKRCLLITGPVALVQKEPFPAMGVPLKDSLKALTLVQQKFTLRAISTSDTPTLPYCPTHKERISYGPLPQ